MYRTFALCIVVSGCLVFSVGCSKKTTEISTPGGKVEVTKEGNDQSSVKITTKEGTTEITAGKKTDLASLGVPIYPGAMEKEDGSTSYAMQGKEGNQSMQMVTLETGDSFDKVAQFYKDQYKGKKANVMDMSHGGSKMTHIILSDDKETTTLMITEKDGKTQVIISKNTKSSSK